MFQTTQEQINATLARDAQQRNGQGGCNQLVKSELINQGNPGSGTCKWAAQFTYSDGTVETLWGL